MLEYEKYAKESDASTTERNAQYPNVRIPPETWAHIVLVYEPKSEQIQLFVNGVGLKPQDVKGLAPDFATAVFDFTNARRGAVLNGSVERICAFNAPLEHNNLQTVFNFLAKDLGSLQKLVEEDKFGKSDKLDKNLLGVSGLSAFYPFEKNTVNAFGGGELPLKLAAPFSLKEGALYCNGSYKDYYNYSGDESIYIPLTEGKGDFSLSANYRFGNDDEGSWGRCLMRINGGDGYVIALYRTLEGQL